MMLEATGEKFGSMRILGDLPDSETLLTCSICQRDMALMLQFAYCGTRGAFCSRCLHQMAGLLWERSRAPRR